MNKWIAEFELEDGDKMPEHMDLEYKGAKIDFHCRPLEQEPRKGHWMNKQRLFDSCSAECSSCHKRSNGYLYDNGFSLVSTYHDFCPKCGSDNREVEDENDNR